MLLFLNETLNISKSVKQSTLPATRKSQLLWNFYNYSLQLYCHFSFCSKIYMFTVCFILLKINKTLKHIIFPQLKLLQNVKTTMEKVVKPQKSQKIQSEWRAWVNIEASPWLGHMAKCQTDMSVGQKQRSVFPPTTFLHIFTIQT